MTPCIFWALLAPTSLLVAASFPIKVDVDQESFDVVVVGAGLTGLTTARNVLRANPNASVLVLEARLQMGGRVRYSSMRTADGDLWVDNGAQFVAPWHTQLIELVRQVGLDVQPQLTCGQRILYKGSRQKRQRLDQMSFDDVLRSSVAANLSRESVAEHARKLPRGQSDVVNRLLQTLFDAPSDQTAAVQPTLTAASDSTTPTKLLTALGHGGGLLVRRGLSEVLRRLADGIEIRYASPVVAVNDAVFPAIVEVKSQKILAKQVVITVPLAALSAIRLIPQPEVPFQQLLDSYVPTGHAYYFTMTFDRAYWRENGKSGEVIFTSKGPLRWMTTFDVSSASECSENIAVLWGIAHFARDIFSDAHRRLEYIRAVVTSLQIPANPLDVMDVNFSKDPFARGSLPVLKPGVDPALLSYFTGFHTIFKNVHIASSELSNVSTGMMNGAVVSANVVSNVVTDGLTSTSTSNEPSNAFLRDNPLPSDVTPFPYSTSSHYPPSLLQQPGKLPSAKNEYAGSRGIEFVYHTSTHYPSTEQPTTTPMKHFSFGNAEPAKINASNNSAASFEQFSSFNYDGAQEVGGQSQEGFVYRTSSVMPQVNAVETTTYRHFSNKNLKIEFNEAPNVPNVPGKAREKAESEGEATKFEYSTTTHYPPGQFDAIGRPEEARKPSPQLLQALNSILVQAGTMDKAQLASRLTAVLQRLLDQN